MRWVAGFFFGIRLQNVKHNIGKLKPTCRNSLPHKSWSQRRNEEKKSNDPLLLRLLLLSGLTTIISRICRGHQLYCSPLRAQIVQLSLIKWICALNQIDLAFERFGPSSRRSSSSLLALCIVSEICDDDDNAQNETKAEYLHSLSYQLNAANWMGAINASIG